MILVTGDEGKLGSRVKSLLGDEAKGYDLQRGQDILDSGALVGAMDGCEMVVHCAGIPHPNAGDFVDYARTNVWGTINICQAARALGVKRVVYFSSTAYYGCNVKGKLHPLYLPIDEGHPPANCEGRSEGALDAYNQSKVMAEQVLAWYGTQQLFETVALRCAPANPKSGQYPEGFHWRSCTDYRRGSLWANCHPDYAAQAAVLAVRYGGKPLWYEAFNLCDRYVPECVELTEFLLEEYPTLRQNVIFRGHEGHSLFDTIKAQKVLGWEPCDER